MKLNFTLASVVKRPRDESRSSNRPQDDLTPPQAKKSKTSSEYFTHVANRLVEDHPTEIEADLIETTNQLHQFNLETFSDEVKLRIFQYVPQKDQKQLRLVDERTKNLIADKHNLANPLRYIRLNPKLIQDEAQFNNFLHYLVSPACQTISLDLSEIDWEKNASKGFSFTKLFLEMKNNNSITSLNLINCRLSDEELSLIGELPNLSIIIMLKEDILDSLNTSYPSRYCSPRLSAASSLGKSKLVVALTKAILSSDLLDQDVKVELLAAKEKDGTPGLYRALQQGHAEAVAAYAQAILSSKLSEEQKVELLTAKDADATPGLSLALEDSHSEAVATYAQAILSSSLSEEQKVMLLAAKDAKGISGLYAALLRNNTEVVATFMTAILTSSLSDQGQFELLSAKVGGSPGLYVTLLTYNTEVMAKFITLISASTLNCQEKVELLSAKNAKGDPGLYAALQCNNTKVIAAFITAILASNLSDREKFELLSAKNANGLPGLTIGLQDDCTEAVATFITTILASSLSDQEKFELLSAKNANGSPGLTIGLLCDRTKAVAAFITTILASNLSDREKVELLSAKHSNRFPGLFLALYHGRTKAAAAFIKAILASSLSYQEKFELLSARVAKGDYALYIALQKGHIKVALTLIMQLTKLGINLLTLNEWMTLDVPEVGCKLHGFLIAIAKDRKFLQDLKQILSDSQINEFYQAVIEAQQPVIALRHPLKERTLDILGYRSSEEFWDKMSEAIVSVKESI